MKEHDYFLELLSNPTFNPKDFLLVGLNSSNTTILDKDVYKNSLTIQNLPIFLTNGEFDLKKLDIAYELALSQYNTLADLTDSDNIFFRDDIFAPTTLRDTLVDSNGNPINPEFNIKKVANPLRQLEGFVNFGIKEEPTRSLREIAESKPVYDYKTGKWLESPNSTWLDNFINPKVLAQWDFDADGNGNPTNDPDKIVYKKGEKKINPETGTYYYETLGGRDIYGREVLSGFDTLTEDGSVWNKYDFFDSDDREKSNFGSLTRAAVLIVPAFIPYVAPIYIGARVGLSLSELFPTIGKIFTGNDNETLSYIEGLNKTFSFSTSDYTLGSEEAGIKADPWTMETGLKLVADVFTLLAEQRWIFKYGNALFSRVNPKLIGEGKEAELARTKLINELAEKEKFNVDLIKPARTESELFSKLNTEKAIRFATAEAKLNERLKVGQDISKKMSMAYMTGITTASSYGEAKLLGASDAEAALFALGYSWGEWKLLNSDIGKWILPELKMEEFEKLAIARSLAKITREAGENLNKDPEVKKTLFKRLFNYGKQLAKLNYSDSILTSTSKMTLSGMLSEGVEETSEELLLDASKQLFNIANSLRGDDTRFTDAWENMATRYSMSAIGGFIGGGLATGLPGYRQARAALRELILSVDNPDANSIAFKKLVNLVLNGLAQEYRDAVKKMEFGSTTLSTQKLETSDGENIYKPANSYEESLDYAIKQKLIEQVNMVEDILNSEGMKFKISDDQLLDNLVRKLLKYYSLLNSNVLGVYTNEFNNLLSDYVEVKRKINTLEKLKNGLTGTDEQNREAKKNWTKSNEQELQELNKDLKELEEKLTMYKDGTMANEFIGEALFEMTVPISSAYALTGFDIWAEAVEGKKFEDISEERLKKLKLDWAESSLTRRDMIHRNYQIFKHNQQAFSNLLKKYEETYFTDKEINPIRELEHIFLNEKEVLLARSLNIVLDTEDFIPIETRAGIWTALLEASKNNLDKTIYDNFRTLLDNLSKSWEETIGIKLPQTVEEFNNLSDDEKLKILDVLELDLDELTEDKDLLQAIEEKRNNFNAQKLDDYKYYWTSFIQNKAVQDEIIKIFKDTKYITPTTKLYLRDFINKADIADPKVVEKLNKELDAIKSSPVEELLSQMVYSLRESGFDTTGMLTDLSLFMSDLANGQNVTEFNYSDDINLKIERTLQLIDLALSHLLASRTELIGELGNVFGYNSTINELQEKFPIEGDNKTNSKKLEKLPELKSTTVDSIIYELAKIKNDLKFYLAVYSANTGATLNDHIILEIKLNKIFHLNILKFIVDIPDDWVGKQDISKALNEATLLIDLISNNKEELSLEERKQLFKEKLTIDKAIFNFFNKNIDKLKDTEELKKLFKSFNFSALSGKTSSINANVEKLDDADFIWHLASLAAINPEAIYNEYQQVIGEEYVPIIGQEEAIRRAYSYILNPSVFEYFANAYNSLIKDEAKKLGHDNVDNDAYIMSMRHFLIEGDPGSGKSSATYKTLYSMLSKFHPELTDDIWFVSNSEENALDTSRNDGMENATVMTKLLYFEKIAHNYEQKFDPTGKIIIGIDELEKDENGIYHYKNIKVNDSIKAPKLIFFDEVSSFSQLDLLLSEDFLKKNGIYAFAAGDFNLLGAQGIVKNSDGKENYNLSGDPNNPRNIYLRLSNGNFIGSWKLGTSMRANNSFKSGNIAKLKAFKEKIKENVRKLSPDYDLGALVTPITLSYFEDKTQGLYGDKTETELSKAIETVKTMLDTMSPDEEYTDKDGNVKKKINKVNFITDDPTNEFAQAVLALNELDKYKGKIQLISTGASQGQEGLYYIIDLRNSFDKAIQSVDSSDESPIDIFYSGIYTALSRAKQGSLLFGNYDNENYPANPLFNSVALSKLRINNLSPSVKKTFLKDRQDIIKSALSEDVKTPEPNWTGEIKKQEEISEEDTVDTDGEDITKEETHKRNIDPEKTIDNSKEGELNILIHTFMCNETGCKVLNSRGEVVTDLDPMDDEAILQLGDFTEDRKDNLNGLVKINETSNKKIKLFQKFEIKDGKITSGKEELLTLLNRLRILGLYCDDYSDLVNRIKILLGNTKEKINIDYVYKTYYEDYKDPNETKRKFEEDYPDYKKYYKGKEETVEGIINDGNALEDIKLPRNLVISMIITMEDGTLLIEIPLAKMSSPLTLLETKEFEGIKALYDEAAKNVVNKEDHKKAFKLLIKQALANNENIPHLKEFAMMLELYQGEAYNNIAYLNKMFSTKGHFTLAKFAKLTGITITNKVKGDNYLDNENYFYNGDYVELDRYKKLMPWRKVSEIMAIKEKNPITINGVILDPGKPFVLISDYYDSTMSDLRLMEEYIKLLKNGNNPPLIKLVYIVPPSVPTELYLYNLHKVLSAKKNDTVEIDKNIGTKNTSFRLLSQVLGEGSPFLAALEEHLNTLPEETRNEVNAKLGALQELIKILTGIENRTQLYDYLNRSITDYKKNEENDSIKEAIINALKYEVNDETRYLISLNNPKLTLRHIFQRELNSLLFGLKNVDETYSYINQGVKNTEPAVELKDGKFVYSDKCKSRIEAFLNTVKWKEVLLHPKAKYDSTNSYTIDEDNSINITLIETDPTQLYLINGKADSTMYVVNVVPMLEWLIRGALGRDPNKIDSDPKNSNIFAEDSKAKGILSGNKRHYEDETATLHQTEDEIKQADNLNKFVEIIPTTLPREMTKTKLKEIFKNLTLEELEKVLKDSREFIYLNTKTLSYFDEKTGKYKIYNNKEVKSARNILFNEDGTTTFENDNGQWIIDENGVSLYNQEDIEVNEVLNHVRTLLELLNISEESRNSILNNVSDIYLLAKDVSINKDSTDINYFNLLLPKILELKLKFNSLTDVPIELKNNMEELLNGMELYVNNIIKEITENNPPGEESSNIKFEQVYPEILKLREILLNSNIPQGTKNIIEKTTDDKFELVIKLRMGKVKNYNIVFGNDLLKYNDDGSISFALNDKIIPVLALFIGKNISTLYNNDIKLIDDIKANIDVDLLENYILLILKEDNNGNCAYKW